MSKENENRMEKVTAWAKRRGFIYPGSSIYGGLANSWDFGPMGVELKNNIKAEWWRLFVRNRSDVVGVDGAIIMNPEAWKASGHVEGFNDPLVEDKKTHERYRLDHLLEEKGVDADGMPLSEMKEKMEELDLKSPKGNELTEPKMFNLMFETYLGAVKDENAKAYLRPETAQAIFTNFKNVLDTTRIKVPFGIAQIGKAFRNEITTGNFIFRTREFEQMEMEYFTPEAEWETWFEYWKERMHEWIKHLGISPENFEDNEIPEKELAHYSKRTIDIEYKYPFGTKELYGLAYRTDYDLKQHAQHSNEDLSYTDPETGEKYIPHVIEPTFGVERTVLAVMLEFYTEEEVEGGEERVVAKFPRWMAPIKAGVFPLVRKDENLTKKAGEICDSLKESFYVQYDEDGAIGKRYRRHDEIGTPVCITVDNQTAEDNTVTLRDRDSMQQIRVNTEDLKTKLTQFYAGEDFGNLEG